MNSDLAYPIGKLDLSLEIDEASRLRMIAELAEAPALLEAAAAGLSDEQLDTPYRPGGWTLRQTVHHVADTHSVNLFRVRMALTSELPQVTGYNVNAIAELSDAKGGPIAPSLALVRGSHERLVYLLRNLKPEDFAKSYVHPQRGPISIDLTLLIYSWHARHHTAHITTTRERMGW